MSCKVVRNKVKILQDKFHGIRYLMIVIREGIERMHVFQVCRDNYLVFVQCLEIFINDINAFLIWSVISVSFYRRLSIKSNNIGYHLFSI